MMEKVVPSGGQGAVEFNASEESGSVESRISLVRALVEDIAHSGEQTFTQQITVDDSLWTVHVQPTK